MKNSALKLITLAAVTAFTVACGSDDAETGVTATWNAICESSANVEAANCPEDMDNSGMVFFCLAMGSAVIDSPECEQKLNDYAECNETREWACMEGGEVPMVVNPDPCEALAEPFVISLGEGGESGECIDESKLQ